MHAILLVLDQTNNLWWQWNDRREKGHCAVVTGSSCCLKSPANWPFVQHLAPTNTNDNLKAPHCCAFCVENPPATSDVDSRSCHGVNKLWLDLPYLFSVGQDETSVFQLTIRSRKYLLEHTNFSDDIQIVWLVSWQTIMYTSGLVWVDLS